MFELAATYLHYFMAIQFLKKPTGTHIALNNVHAQQRQYQVE